MIWLVLVSKMEASSAKDYCYRSFYIDEKKYRKILS
jgi:hypothetical protein